MRKWNVPVTKERSRICDGRDHDKNRMGTTCEDGAVEGIERREDELKRFGRWFIGTLKLRDNRLINELRSCGRKCISLLAGVFSSK